jgi:hypothetical protein
VTSVVLVAGDEAVVVAAEEEAGVVVVVPDPSAPTPSAGGVPKEITSPVRVISNPRLALRLTSLSKILSAVFPVTTSGAPETLLKKTGRMVP